MPDSDDAPVAGVNLEDVPTEEIEKELICRTGDFLVLASKKITEAASLLAQKDLDSEGPIADAIQALMAALKIVRDLKKGASHG